MKKYKILCLVLVILLFFIGSCSAADLEDNDVNQTLDDCSADVELNQSLLQSYDDEQTIQESDEIVVNDWGDLQYYCSLSDNDYTLRLKEDTNYYPVDPGDSGNQILVNNNVKIIGSSGAYFGDASPDPRNITYTAIVVPDGNGKGITLQNVTFKWIGTRYQPDGVFLQMAGNAENTFENCYFTEISTNLGHSSILHIKLGHASIVNCTFINCTTDFGCLSVYHPDDDPTGICYRASMDVTDCYFEGNYARTEPGCINNCGILVVNNSTFYRNSAFWWAGAIHTHGGANTTIYDSDFIDNVAGWNGGALYTYSYLQIYNSRFIGNNCTTNNGGGAIGACKYLHAPYIHIEDSLFENNENTCWGLDELSTSGTGRGGAISLMDEGGLEVYNSIFIKNSASIGTAICAINGGLSYGSPDVRIVGNQFINHTRIGDVLDVRVVTGSVAEIRDNYFLNNSIVFTKLKLEADDPTSAGSVTFHIDVALKNPSSYDLDILDKSKYYVYVDGAYSTTVSSRDFTLNLGKGNTANVYVVPSISNSRSNEVYAGIAKTYIYVSQSSGNDNNDGMNRSRPVKTLAKAIQLANATENIVIMDGTFRETDLTINYNLTITAENNAAITVTGNAFTITDGDVKFENLTFKNSKYGSNTKTRLITQTSTGFLILKGCIFENNEYKAHIEADGMVEGENLIVTNNKDGSFIRANSISLKSSIFTSNTVTYTLYKALLFYKTETKKFEVENLTFIDNTVSSGCIGVKKNKATITGCNFIGNQRYDGTSSTRSSGIHIEESCNVLVESCKFINNTDTGKYASVIYITSGTLVVRDSIFLNNSYENDNEVIINGGETYLKKLQANNNWWGNTPDNLTKPALKVYGKSNQLPNGWDPAEYWLVLNVTSLSNNIELNKEVPVQFIFTQIDNDGNVSGYDGYNLPSFELELNAVNGTCSDNKITVENGMATTYFTLTQKSSASLTGSFNGISTTINFEYIKSIPEMTINLNNISVGENATVTVDFNLGVTGEVILKTSNLTLTQTISNSKATFVIPNLSAGIHSIELNYTGDDRYEPLVKNATLSVSKHNSTTTLSVGEVELNKDVIFTISVSDGATGSVDVYVNGVKETIGVGETYPIRNITRGDYVVRAVYTGDDYYLSSEDECSFEIGKLIPTFSIVSSDIVYGEDTIVNVTLDSNVTGMITVIIDGKPAGDELVDGKVSITIPNVDAGSNKLITVLYSGDHNYKNASANATYNVAKADLDFTILSDSIKLGLDAVVKIQLPARVGGTVTIRGIRDETRNVPASGLITLTYEDLGVGTYTVSAEYNGNNYNTVLKSTTFNVSDWNVPQWANEAGNIQHTGKSQYDSDVNGEIRWSGMVDEITGNLAIDSDGNIYVTTMNGIYSFSPDGDLRWTYISTAAGSYFSGISISRDVVISPKANDTLYFINQTTGERYGHANLYQGSSYFVPVVDSNGNIFISGQGDANNPNLIIIPYKMWENGGNPIEISLGSSPVASPTIINGNLVCVPCADGLKIVSVSDKSITASVSGIITKGTSIAGDGNIIYSFLGDSIVALSESGQRIWTQGVTDGIGEELFLDNEHGLYSVNAQGVLYRYDILNEGAESRFIDVKVTSGILIGSEGNLYFASNEFFYAADYDGNILWKANLGDNITGTPIMDENGIIYVNSFNKVYALQKAGLKDVSLSVTAHTIYVGADEEIIIALNENATGFVTIEIKGNVSQVEIVNGNILKTLSDLPAGNYTIMATYSGDSRYAQSSKSAEFRVLKINPNMFVDVTNIKYGENAIFNIDLANNATGMVTVSVNSKINSADVKNGQASISISGLGKGDYGYVVSYSGDAIYDSATSSGQISVDKTEFTLNVQVNGTYHVGDPVEFVITGFPLDASGKVNVTVGELYNYSTVTNGQAKVVFNGLKANNYIAIINYVDDVNYMANQKTVTFDVVKQDVSFNVDVRDIYVDEDARFVISGLPEDATGSITVNVDGKSESGNPTNGEVIIYVSGLTAGSKNAVVTFTGDDKYNTKSLSREFKVNKIDPRLDVDDIGNVHVYESVEFNAYSDASGNLSVSENGRLLSNVQFSDGVANIRIANGFTYGNHTILIQYHENYKYLAKNVTRTFFADKFYPNMKVVNYTSNIYNITFEIELPQDVTGDINIIVDNITYPASASSRYVTVPNSGAGNYTAKIIYPGDSKYHSDSLTLDVSVNKTFSQINVSVEDIYVGDSAVFNITLNPDAGGSVEVSIGTIKNSTTVIDGHAIVIINNLGFGSKNARITYIGDSNYKTSIVDRDFMVNKVTPTINVNAEGIHVGDSAIFEVDLNFDATGNVIVYVDGKSNSSNVTEGKAKITINGLTSGIKTALVNYIGDDKYLKGNSSCNISVDKMDSPIIVSIEDIDYNSVAVVNIVLPDGVSGEVNLTIGNDTYTRNIVISNISFSIPNLGAGEHMVNVIYSGDGNFKGNSTNYTFKVNKVKPSMNLIVNKNVRYGDSVNLTIEMSAADGYITVFVDSTQVYHEPLNKTKVVCLDDLSVGTHVIGVIYSGDDNYLNSSDYAEITVKKEIPQEDRQFTWSIPQTTTSPEFTISLPSDAQGTFTVYVNGTAYLQEVISGSATVKAENLKVGDYNIYAVYGGDDTYYGFVTENRTINVPKASVPGGVNAFTLNYPNYSISLPSDATGNLVVTVDGKSTYSKSLVNGYATLNIGNLASGTHQVVISYSGDEKYSSISKNDVVTVKEAAPLKVATKFVAGKKTFKAKTNVKKYSVTLKTSAGKAVKKVTVTIKIKGKTYSAKTNNKGKAIFKIKKLTKKGKYTAVLKFKGNKNYKASSKKVKIIIK